MKLSVSPPHENIFDLIIIERIELLSLAIALQFVRQIRPATGKIRCRSLLVSHAIRLFVDPGLHPIVTVEEIGHRVARMHNGVASRPVFIA